MKNKEIIQCQDEVSVKRNRSKDIFTCDKASKFLPSCILSQGSSGQRWSTKIKLKKRWKFMENRKSMGRRGESQDGGDRRGHNDRWVIRLRASQVVLVVKNPPTNAGDIRTEDLIPGSGSSHGGGHGNSLWYSYLENPMDRGAWRVTVHRVTKS